MSVKPKIKMSSNRNFGLVFFVFFLVLGIWPITNDGEIRIWSIYISLSFLTLSLIKSKILTPLNILWFKLGIALGIIVAPIVMAAVFFLVVTPIGVVLYNVE